MNSIQTNNSNSINSQKLFVTCGYQPNGSIKIIENGIKVTVLSSQLSIEGYILIKFKYYIKVNI